MKIIHNPKCSKSRQALEILFSHGEDPEIIEYLNGDLDRGLLNEALSKLGKRPFEVLRKKEDEFKALDLDLENDEEVKEAILKHPRILERPIIIADKKAVLGRPPENIFELL